MNRALLGRISPPLPALYGAFETSAIGLRLHAFGERMIFALYAQFPDIRGRRPSWQNVSGMRLLRRG